MRRTITVAIILGLLVGALIAPAEAQRKKKKKKKKPKRIERVVEHSYDFPSPGVPGVAGVCLASVADNSGCINVPTARREKFVMIEVNDALGLGPAVVLAQNTDPDSPGFQIFHTFCGATEEPVPVPEPGAELRISVYAAPAADCLGIGTTGDFEATLSNLP